MVVIFLVGGIVGFLIASRLSGGGSILSANQGVSDAFRSKLKEKIDAGILPIMLGSVTPSVSFFQGEITQIGSDSLSLKVMDNYVGSDFVDFVLNQPNFYEIKVAMDSNTKIVQFVIPNPTDTIKNALPPAASEKEIKLSDLQIGQRVSVQLASAFDISKNNEVTALKISAMQPMVAASPVVK